MFPFGYSGAPKDDGEFYSLHLFLEAHLPPTISVKPLPTKRVTGSASIILSKGGCTCVGDTVGDIPPEACTAFGRPTGRYTCAGGGVDPIYNLMDDTDDSRFAAGQLMDDDTRVIHATSEI